MAKETSSFDEMFSLKNLTVKDEIKIGESPLVKTKMYIQSLEHHQELYRVNRFDLIQATADKIRKLPNLTFNEIRGNLFEQMVLLGEIHCPLSSLRDDITGLYASPEVNTTNVDVSSPLSKSLTGKFIQWCRSRRLSTIDSLNLHFNQDTKKIEIAGLIEIKMTTLYKANQLKESVKSLGAFLRDFNGKINHAHPQVGPIQLFEGIDIAPGLQKILVLSSWSPKTTDAEAYRQGYDTVLRSRVDKNELLELTKDLIRTKKLKIIDPSPEAYKSSSA